MAQVNNVRRCIMREYKENGCQPILYWKIILNPESFTKSIENMSHLAFLTQDKSCRMSLGKGNKNQLEGNKNLMGKNFMIMVES